MSAFLQQQPHSIARRLAGAVSFAAAVCLLVAPLAAQAAPAIERSRLIAQAERSLAEGKPFAATRLLAPVLASPGPRDPALLLLAARAAAGWEGWGSVVRLLTQQTWLDELAGGEGRALLARARVERGDPALDDARRAAAAARGGETAGPRQLTLARAYDRADLLDSAAAGYLRAARLLPAAADWLRLRAAGVLADSASRATLYREVTLPAAIPRIRWTEALARDRTGDWRGAARIYESLGATLAALRLRLRAAESPAERASVRKELLALLGSRPSAEDVQGALALLDGAFPELLAEEELLVGRRAAGVDLARAAGAFSRASRSTPLSDSDKLTYGGVLARLGRHPDAMALFEAVETRELLAQSQYLRARSILASRTRLEAIAALRRVSLAVAGDSATAATAGYLIGDLLVDEGDERGARQAYLEVARRYPRTSHGARGALQAAVLAWVHGERAAAALEFAGLAARAAETTEGIAALYWSGRCSLAAGDSLAAARVWRSILGRFPASYYTVPAAERLGVSPVREPPPTLMAAPDTGLTTAVGRAAMLERLGLRVEARFELDRLSRQAEAVPGALLLAARAFAEGGLVARAYRLAVRVPDAVPQRLAFPLPGAEAVEAAREAGVDPLLAAALIRQESAFDPAARSRADARGLMQVLPSVGAGMAPAAGIAEWDPALLYQPEVNLHFGVAHLAQTLRRYPQITAALAAYNAGERPTNRWLALPGADDPDVFIERVQFAETRDYIRRILRNVAVYRALYPTLP